MPRRFLRFVTEAGIFYHRPSGYFVLASITRRDRAAVSRGDRSLRSVNDGRLPADVAHVRGLVSDGAKDTVNPSMLYTALYMSATRTQIYLSAEQRRRLEARRKRERKSLA